MSEAIDAVKEALNPKTFDIVKAVQGKAYPKDDVFVYFDITNVRELITINRRMVQMRNANLTERKEFAELEERAGEIADKVKESGMRFHLTGVGQDTIDEATEQTKTAHDFNVYILAKSIEKVENSAGEVDERDWDMEDVRAIYNALPPGEYERLQEVIMGLSFANTIFDEAVDAGFLPRR